MPDVLKNFLEAYLLDQNRFFKLVYDFPVAKGNLSKIFASDLDEKSRIYWAGVISNFDLLKCFFISSWCIEMIELHFLFVEGILILK